MKIIFSVISTLFLITTLYGNQNSYILLHDGLIDQRAQDKILQIGSEVQSKLGVKLYVFIKENNGMNQDLPFTQRKKIMKDYEKMVTKDLKGSYAVLMLVLDQRHATVIMSDDIKPLIDKRDIIDDYVTPVLASKDKNTLFTKTSAAILNGYAQMADALAESKELKLESSIGSGGKVISTIWKMFMYTLVLGGIILYAIIVMREKKYKKEAAKKNDA